MLHEDREEFKLIKQLAGSISLDSEFETLVQPYKFGTKSNFFKAEHADYQELIQQVAADQIGKVLFVLDADDPANDRKYGGYENALSEITKITKDLDLEAISKIFICCDPQTQLGNVESLLLSTLDDKKKACIDHFLECSEFGGKDNDKAILKTIYAKGFPNAPYNYEHAHFDDLKAKIRWLLE